MLSLNAAFKKEIFLYLFRLGNELDSVGNESIVLRSIYLKVLFLNKEKRFIPYITQYF